MPVFTNKHVAVTVKDGTGSPITATLGPGPGDLSFSGLEQGDVGAIRVMNRGAHLELVEGPTKELTGSVTVYHNGDLTSTGSVLAAIRKTDDYASGVAVDPGLVSWTLDLVVTMTRGAVTNTFTFNTCRLAADYKEAEGGNTMTINFTCFEGVTIT